MLGLPEAASSAPSTLEVLQTRAAATARRDARDADGVPTMTPALLREACLEHGGFSTPELNDRLYLHFRGFRVISGLEAYVGLKALWLDSNAIAEVGDGLRHLVELRCLFLQQNCLTHCRGLESLSALQTLNISGNNIETLDGLAMLPRLQTLHASKNVLSSTAAVEELRRCVALLHLDLGDNALPTEEGGCGGVLSVLGAMPLLSSLILKGNPVCRDTRNYRKTTLTNIPRLRYLDDRPVFELERTTTDAWARGGADAERAARAGHEQAQRDAQLANIDKFALWSATVREKRAGELAAHNAERAVSGLPPVTELPHKRHVSYSSVSSRAAEEALLASRRSGAAAFRADLDGSRGSVEDDRTILARLNAGVAGAAAATATSNWGEAAAAAAAAALAEELDEDTPLRTEVEEEEEERRVLEAVCKREREEFAREREAASAVHAAVVAGLHGGVSPPPPPPPAVGGGGEGSTAAGSENIVSSSIRIFRERRAAAEAAAAAAAEGRQVEEERGEEDEEEEVTVDDGALRTGEEWAATGRSFRQSLQHMPLPYMDLTTVTADSPPPQVDVPPASVLASPPAVAVEAPPPPSMAQDASTELATHAPALLPTLLPELWTPPIDAALLKLTPQARFEFDKVARALQNAAQRGHFRGGAEDAAVAGFVATLDGARCSARYAVLLGNAAAARAVAVAEAAPAALSLATQAAPLPPAEAGQDTSAPAAAPAVDAHTRSPLVKEDFGLAGFREYVTLPPHALPSAVEESSSGEDNEGGSVPLSRGAIIASVRALSPGARGGDMPNTDVDALE